MKLKTLLFSLLLLPFLWGCADSHNLELMALNTNIKLKSGDSVYIAQSKDGIYGSKHYQGSGQMVNQVIQAELLAKLNHIDTATAYSSYKDTIQYATENNYDFLIYPTILHWEDRATEWSGIPDKVKLKITIIDLKTHTEVKTGIIDGQSGLATLGGDHPQDLLPEPIKAFMQDVL
ncbi:hypothetical protein VHA01S_020_00410 [Vibrio halioticoli NBRC 102217]|uniref:DUF4823 domain-containing protein n=1 Tax=Vibrio halioticoli NBRC 102217 TaxID=1219072 RepID=V5FKM8_9VIBR|nr:DUF4823 domain-containing protein [Vibrio halioticoli]GAD89457.1 hypothetical protein VHA01S_020_00410 [Vibrio halioticoli NBRC 102217]